MKLSKCLIFLISMISLAVTFGCGGSGGGDGSTTGTMSMSITDAKPLLPELPGKEITNVFVTIDEVLVHKSGGAWIPLDLPDSPNPFVIDLLQFSDGNTTELVPPVEIEAGKYTQVRLSVVSAKLRFNNDLNDEVEITVPSGNLKTDQNFDFDVSGSSAVDITIDFDLSKSLVLEGPDYKLKPVLHIVKTTEAATIEGIVENTKFGDTGNPDVTPYVLITVFDSNDQEYTRVKVEQTSQDADGNPLEETSYKIFWLVPNQAYTVKINYNPEVDDDPTVDGTLDDYDETVDVPSSDPNDVLLPGEVYPLDFLSTI